MRGCVVISRGGVCRLRDSNSRGITMILLSLRIQLKRVTPTYPAVGRPGMDTDVDSSVDLYSLASMSVLTYTRIRESKRQAWRGCTVRSRPRRFRRRRVSRPDSCCDSSSVASRCRCRSPARCQLSGRDATSCELPTPAAIGVWSTGLTATPL